MNTQGTLARRSRAFAAGVALPVMAATAVASADDTEIFFGQAATDVTSSANSPNILFLLDDSASMNRTDKGQDGTRLQRLKEAMDTLLTDMTNVNVGIMSMNGENGGGPVRYPVTPLDKPVCVDNDDCKGTLIYSTVDNVDNDTEERISNGVMLPGGNTLAVRGVGSSANHQLTGLRFTDLDIPQGATITGAYLDMTASAADTGDALWTVWADDTDSAASFSKDRYDLSSRPSTTARAVFPMEDWIRNEQYTSADLKDVVQEIVDRGDWCGGNDIALVVAGTDTRRFHSVESSVKNSDNGLIRPAPALRITYEDGAIPAGQGCRLTTAIGQALQSNFDGFEESKTTKVESTEDFIPIGKDTTNEFLTGLVYKFLDVPQGVEIVDARIDFHVYKASTNDFNVQIKGHDVDKSWSIAEKNKKHLSKRVRTGAVVDWSFTDDVEHNERVVSPNIAPVVQEIVGRPGWTPNNRLMMLLDQNGTDGSNVLMWSFDGVRAKTSKIYVTYKTYSDGVGTVSAERTARDEMKDVMSRLQLNFWTPLLSQQYEAAQYFLGKEVTYGRKRGGTTILPNMRVSHPDSYTGGKLYTPWGCSELDPFNENCTDEEILSDASGSKPTYISPIEDACQTNHIVILTDGGGTKDDAADRVSSLIGKDIADCERSGSNSSACGVDLQRWLYKEDHAPHIDGLQNIVTHTVAFNLATGGATNYLIDAAAAGGGTFRRAESAEDLIDAFTTIVQGAQAIDTSFTAPGATVNQFNRLAHRSDVYLALFKPTDTPRWEGNLKRYTLGVDANSTETEQAADLLDADGVGAIDTETGFFKNTARSLWDHIDDNGNVTLQADGPAVALGGAGSRIGVDGIDRRQMYTFMGDAQSDITSRGVDLSNGGHDFHEANSEITAEILGIVDPALSNAARAAQREAVLKWARGVDILDSDGDNNTTESRRRMGDPMHSQPVVVNYGDEDSNGDAVYSSIIYVSTNDGVLHAIDSEYGNELWAFTPKDLLANHKALFENSADVRHPYGLDGHLSLWRDDPDEDLVVEDGESVYLYVGMRRGGDNYYAFNITDPQAPKLAWVIAGGDAGGSEFGELGQSWSEATHAHINDGGTQRDVLIFGAGYDVNQDPDPTRDANGNTVTMNQDPDAIGRGLFIVDARTGEKLWSVAGPDLRSGASADQRFADMQYSIPGNIRIVDIDLDGNADQLYAADMGGQVWRFDFTGSTRDTLLSGGVVAKLSDTDDEGHRRFYTEPDVALVQERGASYLAVSIGSGWRAHPLNDVVEDAQYVVRIPDVRGAPQGYGMQNDAGGYRPITEDDLRQVNAGTDVLDNPDLTHGWFMRFTDAGEKALGTSLIFRNTLYFTTYVPQPAVGACQTALGSGFAYSMSIIDGSPTLDFDGDGKVETDFSDSGDNNANDDVRFQLRHPGPPPNPSLLFPENLNPEVFIGTEKIPTNISSGTSRTFWVDTGPDSVYAEQTPVR